MSRIRVTIDELVLRGLAPAERQTLMEGLRNELARTLADPAQSARFGGARRTPVIRLGAITLEPGAAGGRRFGAGLARRIAGRLRS
jgi:hypothetical protein